MRISKYERKWNANEVRKEAMRGSGLFIYENNTSGDLLLPRATKTGLRKVNHKARFQGDDYYMCMVRNNELRLIEVLVSPQAEAAQLLKESMEEKLLTEQPPIVTNEGTIEYVQSKQAQKLNENRPNQSGDILLNENPLDGIDIIG